MIPTPEQLEQQQQVLDNIAAQVARWNQPLPTGEIPVEPKAVAGEIQKWETPTHEQIDLSTAVPEDFGLDPYDMDNSLVKAIYKAQDRAERSDPLPLVPAIFKQTPNWLRWRLENVDGRDTKVPYQVNGSKASSTNPATWTDYRTAASEWTIDRTRGVGFALTKELGVIGFDLDGSLNPQNGEIALWAKRIIDTLNSYTEITPSGTGVRVFVVGKKPDGKFKFHLALSAGFGTKVQIEVYDHARYFTMTGNRLGVATEVAERDVTEAYKLCYEIMHEHPTEKVQRDATSTLDDSSSVQIKRSGMVVTTKLALLMHGEIVNRSPFTVNMQGNSIEYPSHSEADMALVTLLAMKHNGDAGLIDADFRESSLYRAKWEREDYRNGTIQKAIRTAKHDSILTIKAETESGASSVPNEDAIPVFDTTVITGIYRDVVDLAVRGTTIPPQYAFLNAKIYFGARMAGKATFEGLDCDSSYYGSVISVTGTSKGESWRRTIERILLNSQLTEAKPHLKVIYGADSGAGLKDTFFDPPQELPVICYVDEVTSLGHKAGEKKNPEILDTIIELADSHRISRVLAKRGKGKSTRTHENARLSVYLCGQDGPAFMSAFSGRTKIGLFDRLYPEFAEPIEAGELPEIKQADIIELHTKIAQLDFNCQMTMSPDTKTSLEAFWRGQTGEIRKKIRFKKYLMLDMYMAAFGRGETVAEPADLDTAITIFNRQVIIRRVCFTGEIPDRVGFYIGYLKRAEAWMHKRLAAGEPMAKVAMSLRDLQTESHSFRDNEGHIFNRAWSAFHEEWLTKVHVTGANGHTYEKFVPVPREDETWLPIN